MNVIDISSLLTPVSESMPAGEELGNELGVLEQSIEPRPDPNADPNDPEARDRMLTPNWLGARDEALSLLERSKDLRIVVVLLQVLPNTDGLPGFADGLSLLRGLLETFWDSLYPLMDDGDPFERGGVLSSVADRSEAGNDLSDTQGMLAYSFRRLTLFRDLKLGPVCLRDIKQAQQRWKYGGQPARPLNAQQIEGALSNSDNQATLQTTAGLLRRVDEDVNAIAEQLATLIQDPQDLPTFQQLSAEIEEARRLVEASVSGGATPPDEAADASQAPDGAAVVAGTVTVASAAPPAPPGEINSREDVAEAIDRICDYYNRCEPSSPVPLLLQRARRLAALSFMEILADLAPTGVDEARQMTGAKDDTESDSDE